MAINDGSQVPQAVYDHFRRLNEWPLVRDLQLKYRTTGDFRTIAARLGYDRIVCPTGPDGRCYLPLSELATREGAGPDLELFCAALRFAARHFIACGATALSATDFGRELELDAGSGRRLGVLLQLEQFIWVGRVRRDC